MGLRQHHSKQRETNGGHTWAAWNPDTLGDINSLAHALGGPSPAQGATHFPHWYGLRFAWAQGFTA